MTKNPETVQTFKILVVGDSNVGKSSLMTRFVHGVFHSQYTATIGVDFQIGIVNINGYKCRLQIWDTAGQERFRSITSSYYRGADGIIIVYDVTNKASFTQVKDQITEMDSYCEKTVPRILVGNKNDNDNKTNKVISTDDALEYAKESNLLFFEVSVKDNKNITELFNEMTKLVLKQRLEEFEPIQNNNITTTRIDPKQTTENINKKKCCPT
ncbi:unnamed protein product [Adineta steineri]|uniref:Uncharacterized protein n=1 Tax=Adineta steineri TaxID=433720 RepID=A0A819B0F4_9BILA|nr:unnamed protein product [Adineta steineri]CAF1105283.1 unnamed protein product [Adineta steineri]CAF1160393.1 unnamed protein product [Adineta steineri]CAF3708783.1 unnamed protein product [Adineta steineri]CAF3737561.1 unnamed protein product [Adineta steineri]